MKKYLFIVMALLLTVGVAHAASIPGGVDAKSYPEIWTTTVYTNATSDISSREVVIWEFDHSTGNYADQCNWVNTTTTQSHPRVAGVVVSPKISALGYGEIAIRGPVPVLFEAQAGSTVATADDLVGTSTDAGMAEDYTDAADNGHLGIAITSGGFENQPGVAVVFVNPGWAD